jgi:tetratricopeptide (TPR) repeat protein
MAQQATKGINSSLEKEAWDLFEVGANEEVLQLAQSNPNHFYIQHLGYLATYELNGQVTTVSPKGISPLSPIVEALANFSNGRYKEAANQVSLYFQSPNSLICYGIISLAVKIYFRSENYAEAQSILSLYKKKFSDFSFIKEEIIATYHLRKYEDVIKSFREHIKHLNDVEIHKVVGMSLLFLDRHKEANSIFESIPGRATLPSFEEKRESYKVVFSNISKMESNSAELSLRELEDMGFAYLFHGEYEKAEKTFLSITSKLKSSLCTA